MRSILVMTMAGLGCASTHNFLRGYARGRSDAHASHVNHVQPGLHRLLLDDFQGLNTDTMERSAVPWKVLASAMLAVRRQEEPHLTLSEESFHRLLSRRFGFVRPSHVANARGEGVPLDHPAGIVVGTVRRSLPAVELQVANTGCSTCHSANLYDDRGYPTKELWVGLPSSSINMERYAVEVYAALTWAKDHPEELMQHVVQIFPLVSQTELDSIESYVLPGIAERIDELDATLGRFTPYSNGGPGLTNGAATLLFYLGMLDESHYRKDLVAFTAIPDFTSLAYKSSALCDGVYAPPGADHYASIERPSQTHRNGMAGVAAMVTLGTLGVAPKHAVENQYPMRDVIDFLFDDYETPAFPGNVDMEIARAGEQVFGSACAHCHGHYQEDAEGRYRLGYFPNDMIPQEEMGTDPVRWSAVDGPFSDTLLGTSLGEVLSVRRGRGYIAPVLSGVWATAPYLHNGSVPTLWHLLHPESRPARFEVGGHRLDYTKIGLAGETDSSGLYRDGSEYRPWSVPEIYDTRLPGRSSAGHEVQVERLNEEQKVQIVEFLKLL